jgi:hypothetical protein
MGWNNVWSGTCCRIEMIGDSIARGRNSPSAVSIVTLTPMGAKVMLRSVNHPARCESQRGVRHTKAVSIQTLQRVG